MEMKKISALMMIILGIGLASEYLSLSDKECVAVARSIVGATRGRVPVVMSCGRPMRRRWLRVRGWGGRRPGCRRL